MARPPPPERRKPARTLTIQETASFYRLRLGTARSTPLIALRGQWLAQAGFRAGTRVSIAVEHGRLIITPDTTGSEP